MKQILLRFPDNMQNIKSKELNVIQAFQKLRNNLRVVMQNDIMVLFL